MAPNDSDNTAIDKIIFLLFTNAVTLFEILILKSKSPMIIPNSNTPIHSLQKNKISAHYSSIIHLFGRRLVEGTFITLTQYKKLLLINVITARSNNNDRTILYLINNLAVI